MKKDKEQDFKKRVLGEKSLSKCQKEHIRMRLQRERDEFDLSNLGNFKMVYPTSNLVIQLF